MRRYFADLLAILSNRYQLCPTARHLANNRFCFRMGDKCGLGRGTSPGGCKQPCLAALPVLPERRHYYLTANYPSGPCPSPRSAALPPPSPLSLPLSCKFEEKEDRVPKLEQLNSLGFMCSLNLVLNKKDLIKMELLLLETFGWNLCMPTPAHFIDYYLHASVQEGDLYNGWPLSSLSKTKAFMDKYTHYFLEVSLQDHAFLSFRPSQVAAACVAASRICLQISPSWTTALHLLTGYTWDHLTQCIELMLLPASSSSSSSCSSSSSSSTPQLLFQPDGFPHISQHSPSLSQLQALADSHALGPVVNVSQDFLQSHRVGLLTGAPSITAGSGFPSYPSLTSGLQPVSRAMPLPGPISVQMALAGEPRHCLSMAYSGGYLGSHHTFAAGCFDR
uniref:Cyclin-J-like protein n=1 Tax=Cynoglossus semilaevis TaxID=244447 RepID=A0A3P8WII3_CYNSE